MKKLVFVVIIVFGFFILFFSKTVKLNYIENILLTNLEEACFVINENNIDENFSNVKHSKQLKVGNKYLIYANNFNLESYKNIKFDYLELLFNNLQLSTFINKINLNILYKEIVNNKPVYYGYFSNLKKEVYLNNFKINLQIIEMGEYLKVGYPMIYSSF